MTIPTSGPGIASSHGTAPVVHDRRVLPLRRRRRLSSSTHRRVHVRRPRIDYDSHVAHLDRNELGAIFVAAGLSSPRDHALVSLLASERAARLRSDRRRHRSARPRTRTSHAGGGAQGRQARHHARSRHAWPGLSTWPSANGLKGRSSSDADGQRLDRHAAGRIVRRVARRAGINKRVGPHTLRHAFITAALDAGVPLRDVQEAASHADPRTTMRYDRGRAVPRPPRHLHRRHIHRRRGPLNRPPFGAPGPAHRTPAQVTPELTQPPPPYTTRAGQAQAARVEGDAPQRAISRARGGSSIRL